jgi:hypothetical protein
MSHISIKPKPKQNQLTRCSLLAAARSAIHCIARSDLTPSATSPVGHRLSSADQALPSNTNQGNNN